MRICRSALKRIAWRKGGVFDGGSKALPWARGRVGVFTHSSGCWRWLAIAAICLPVALGDGSRKCCRRRGGGSGLFIEGGRAGLWWVLVGGMCFLMAGWWCIEGAASLLRGHNVPPSLELRGLDSLYCSRGVSAPSGETLCQPGYAVSPPRHHNAFSLRGGGCVLAGAEPLPLRNRVGR